MKILITLREVLKRCDNWSLFCDEIGYDVYCLQKGAENLEIELTEIQARTYGII